MIRTCICLVCLTFICSIGEELKHESDKYDDILPEVLNACNCDTAEANDLMYSLLEFSQRLGANLTSIADPRRPADERRRIAQETTNEFFESDSAIVWVSNHSSNLLHSWYATDYFNRLINLDNTQGYIRVELTFEVYIGFLAIKRIGVNEFEVVTVVNQIFRSWNDAGIAYQDVTRKKLRQRVTKAPAGSWHIKLSEIGVKHTYKYKDWPLR